MGTTEKNVITNAESTRHKAQLQTREQRLKFAFNAGGVGAWYLDAANNIFDCDEYFRKLHDIQTTDVITIEDMLLHIHEGDRQRVKQTMDDAMDAVSDGELNVEFRTAASAGNNSKRLCVKGKAYCNEDGKLLHFSGIVQDITIDFDNRVDQKKLSYLVENTSDYLALGTMEGNIYYMNAAGLAMIGLEAYQLPIPNYQLLFPGQNEAFLKRIIDKLLLKGRWNGNVLLRNFTTGEKIPVWVSAVMIYDEITKEPIGRATVARDLRKDIEATNLLKLSEQRYMQTIAQSPVAVAVFEGPDFIIESANAHALQLLGKDESIIGKPFMVAMPEIENQPYLQLMQNVFATGQPYYGYENIAYIERNGVLEEGYYDFVLTPLCNINGTIRAVTATGNDVTKKVIAKKELEQSEQKFKNLILQADIATGVYTGEDMIIEIANDAMLKLWGKSSEVIGMKLRDALPELEGQPFFSLLQNVYTTGITYSANEDKADLVVNGKLQSFYFNFTYKALPDAEGHITRILNMALDVTDMVKAREQREEAEGQLNMAIDVAELGTWRYNFEKKYITLSERARKIFGLPGKHFYTSEDFEKVIMPKDFKRITERMVTSFKEGGNGFYSDEFIIYDKKNNLERVVLSTGKALFNEDNKPYLAVGSVRDISLQKNTQKTLEALVNQRTGELQQSNAMLENTNKQLELSNHDLEQYAYAASHDLQEPLRKIKIFSRLLIDELEAGNENINSAYLYKIEQAAGRMSLLIQNVLKISTTSQQNKAYQLVNLTDIINQVKADVDLLIQQKNAAINVSGNVMFEGVYVQINQLFYNLIVNALKFSKPDIDSVINITSGLLAETRIKEFSSLSAGKQYIMIDVADNGIGFKQQYEERIFKLFQRLGSSDTSGTGIGLSLCKKIAESHGGEIRATSKEGEGATFTVVLPLKQ